MLDVFSYSTFTAIMALIALGLAVGVVVARLVLGPDRRNALADTARWLAWIVAAASTVGSLLFSEVYGFEPCLLCWYQRIAMYPLTIILFVGAVRRDAAIRLYALGLSVVGLGISVWHYLLQTFPNLEGGACDPANPCSAKYVNIFDFISIPFMAGAGFLLVTVLLATFSAHRPSE